MPLFEVPAGEKIFIRIWGGGAFISLPEISLGELLNTISTLEDLLKLLESKLARLTKE